MNYEVYQTKVSEIFTPSKSLDFANGVHTVFEYSEPKPDESGFIKLPQVPYEIKEHALKGLVYTFFLTIVGRLGGIGNINVYSYSYFPFIPAAVFTYHYLHPLWYMYNAIIKIELLEGGEKLRLHFKYQSSREVKISQIIKKKEENFLVETYTEPFLYPIEVNYTEEVGKYSLRSHRKFYLYGDSHKCIKNGEVLRAILNNQNIQI